MNGGNESVNVLSATNLKQYYVTTNSSTNPEFRFDNAGFALNYSGVDIKFGSDIKYTFNKTAPTNTLDVATVGYVSTALSGVTSTVVEITGTSQTAQARRIYIPHNASMTTITLPATAAVGDLIQVIGEGAGKWRLQHGNASDIIVGVGGFTTVSGTSRGVEASDQYGTLSIRYANTNKWVITNQNGSIAAY